MSLTELIKGKGNFTCGKTFNYSSNQASNEFLPCSSVLLSFPFFHLFGMKFFSNYTILRVYFSTKWTYAHFTNIFSLSLPQKTARLFSSMGLILTAFIQTAPKMLDYAKELLLCNDRLLHRKINRLANLLIICLLHKKLVQGTCIDGRNNSCEENV